MTSTETPSQQAGIFNPLHTAGVEGAPGGLENTHSCYTMISDPHA